MKLQNAVFKVMKAEDLKRVIDKNNIETSSRRDRNVMISAIKGSRTSINDILESIKLPKLRELCEFQNLDAKGNKPDLISRLIKKDGILKQSARSEKVDAANLRKNKRDVSTSHRTNKQKKGEMVSGASKRKSSDKMVGKIDADYNFLTGPVWQDRSKTHEGPDEVTGSYIFEREKGVSERVAANQRTQKNLQLAFLRTLYSKLSSCEVKAVETSWGIRYDVSGRDYEETFAVEKSEILLHAVFNKAIQEAIEMSSPIMPKIVAQSDQSKSKDIVADNIRQLKALFPDLIAEGEKRPTINVDVLKALVGDQTVTDADEKYGLNWHGKRRARQLALTPSTGTLRPCPQESVDWDATQNLMIEGDNLEVLKLLQKSYAGKVKLIYIDPPYNTGKDFVYPDNFHDNIKNYLALTGQVEDGRKVSSNAESSGRFHTDWLNMMYPRIKLARNLLNPDGIICVSIDNSELSNASIMLDEIFGSECFLGRIVRATGTTTGQDSGGLGQSFDYILCYARDPDTSIHGLPLDEEDEKRFQGEDAVGKYSILQLRKTGNADRREDRPSMFYPIKAPDGKDVLPIGPGGYESRWRFGPEKYHESVRSDLIVWKQVDRDGEATWQPYVKFYLEGRKKRPSPLWDDIDGNKKATIEVKSLLGDKVFNNPKPTALIKRLIQITFGEDDRSGIVMDFFAGSGTTGHAVMAHNAAHNTSYRYILVQLPEKIDSEISEQKIAYKFCAKMKVPHNIAELTKERLRRAAGEVSKESPLFSGDTGFRVFKLDRSNIRAWNPNPADLEASLFDHQDHLLEGRTEADVLYELLLKVGLDLCVPIEQRTIASLAVHAVGGGVLIACLAERIAREEVEALAQGIINWHKEMLATAGYANQDKKGRETTCVFRDSAFEDDVAKANLAALLKQHGIQNVRSL